MWRKNKKWLGWAAALIMLAGTVMPACIPFLEAVSADQEKNEPRIKLTAWIDEKCQSHPHTFKVGQDQIAFDFKLENLDRGSACKPGEVIENVGYALRDQNNRPLFIWSQYKNEKPYEKGGPLSKLELKAGEYTLSVAGGANAKVELSYRIK